MKSSAKGRFFILDKGNSMEIFKDEFETLKREIEKRTPPGWANEWGREVGITGVSVPANDDPKKTWEAGRDDELDAFRHAFVNAVFIAWGRLLSGEATWPEGFAKEQGERHERGRGKCGATMDLHNNKVGRELAPDGATLRKWIMEGKNPQREIAMIIAEAIHSGRLITGFRDPRMSEDCWGKAKQKGKYYVWRTVEDRNVRWEHAVRNGQIFAWDEAVQGGRPGADYNCRCRAEPVDVKYEEDLDKVFKK